MTDPVYRIGMGEGVIVSEPSAVLMAPGLGSCVAVALYSPGPLAGAMAHIMLPQTFGDGVAAFKFADAAVPLLIRRFEQTGANIRTAVIKIAGGARMFRLNGQSTLDVGTRTTDAVLAIFDRLGLRVHARDIGGNMGRTVTLEVRTGRMTVRVAGGAEREL